MSKNVKKKTIGIYMPHWLYDNNIGDRIFTDELCKTITEDGKYAPLRFDLPSLHLSSQKDAEKFLQKHNLILIVEHDSSYFSHSKKYKRNIHLLQNCRGVDAIPFVNSSEAHRIGHNKITTKNKLRAENIPTLDDIIVHNGNDFQNIFQEDTWYVIKPPDNGAGAGVKLVKRHQGTIYEFRNNVWNRARVTSRKKYLKIQHHDAFPLQIALIGLFLWAILWIFLTPGASFTVSTIVCSIGLYYFLHKYDKGYIYHYPFMVEPYFNDDKGGFASLRCTVIGDKVVESVKRINRENITSNISSGGTAETIELTPEQKNMAIKAIRAVGAEYAGVDFLVCGGKSVIGEVNIGPFTIFGNYTGVNVGKIFGKYLIKKCDELGKSIGID